MYSSAFEIAPVKFPLGLVMVGRVDHRSIADKGIPHLGPKHGFLRMQDGHLVLLWIKLF